MVSAYDIDTQEDSAAYDDYAMDAEGLRTAEADCTFIALFNELQQGP